MKEASTIEPTIKRADALRYAIVCFVFVIICVVAPMNPIVGMVCLVWSLLHLMVFCLALGFPTRFLRGISLIDGGFLWCSPMKGRKLIMFSDIVKIEAVCTGSGAQGDDVNFFVSTEQGSVLLQESDLYRIRIIDHFFALPGFQRDRYSEVAAYDVSTFEFFVGKKFLLYERA